MSLAQVLVEEMPPDIEAAFKILGARIGDSSITTNSLSDEDVLFVPYGKRLSPPPRDDLGKNLWELGQLDWINGRGKVVHSVLLAAAGNNAEIKRRIWVAQLELLLPLVERIRLSLISWIESKVGKDWIDKLTENLSAIDRDDIETEIGTLAYHVFRRVSRLSNHKEFPILEKTVWAWRKIRNELAHGRFVPLPMLDDAWASYEEFMAKCV
jgi:hypothetical protein